MSSVVASWFTGSPAAPAPVVVYAPAPAVKKAPAPAASKPATTPAKKTGTRLLSNDSFNV